MGALLGEDVKRDRRQVNREHPPRRLLTDRTGEPVISKAVSTRIAAELGSLVANGIHEFTYVQALSDLSLVRYVVEPDGAWIVVQNLYAEMTDAEILADIMAVRDELGLGATSWN